MLQQLVLGDSARTAQKIENPAFFSGAQLDHLGILKWGTDESEGKICL